MASTSSQISSSSNYKSVQVESSTGLLSLAYQTLPGSEGNGFNATFRVGTYCPPWEGRCGGAAGGCFTQEQSCDGKYDCPETGKDEKGCKGCGPDQFVCGPTGQRTSTGAHYGGRPVCYPAKERCNYQLYCSDGSDERDCTVCQPGTFHCDSDRSVHVRISPSATASFGVPSSQPVLLRAGACSRAGAATDRWTARTARTSSTAPSSSRARSSPRQRWAASSAASCWSSPWAAPVNCTRYAPGNTGPSRLRLCFRACVPVATPRPGFLLSRTVSHWVVWVAVGSCCSQETHPCVQPWRSVSAQAPFSLFFFFFFTI